MATHPFLYTSAFMWEFFKANSGESLAMSNLLLQFANDNFYSTIQFLPTIYNIISQVGYLFTCMYEHISQGKFCAASEIQSWLLCYNGIQQQRMVEDKYVVCI